MHRREFLTLFAALASAPPARAAQPGKQYRVAFVGLVRGDTVENWSGSDRL